MLALWIFLSHSVFSQTLVYCSEASPDYFNPQLSLSGSTYDATFLIYSRLLEQGERGKAILPGLAKKWTVSKDGKTYTLDLRKGVSFHKQAGFKPTRDFQADDVVWSFERQSKKKHPYHLVSGGTYKFYQALGLKDLVADVKKVSKYKVQFILKKPHSVFLLYLSMDFMNILSKEYGEWLIKRGKKEKIDTHPVGTGPFVFKKYTKDTLIRYVRHDSYYKPAAKLKKVIFSITPDPTVRFQKLKRSECHLMAHPQPIDVPFMKKHKGIKVLQNVTYNVSYLAMNLKNSYLKNPKVRRAIAHALNRKFYIQAIYQGFAKVAHSPLPPRLFPQGRDFKTPSYSLSKARKLMKEAGFEKGFKLKLWTLPVSRPYNPNGKKLGELMQADLKKIGIQVELVTYDWSTYLAKTSKGKHDLAQLGWQADIGDPSNFLGTLLTCAARKSGANLAFWCNKLYDQLIHQALLQPLSSLRRKLLYKKALRLFVKDLPWVPLAHTYNFSAHSNKLRGYKLRPFGSETFYNLSLQ